MLKNYLKIAIRNIARHKMFSFINIFGLALSMSVCLMVLVRIKDQVGYDKFHPYSERMYRLISHVTNQQGSLFGMATTPLPLATTLAKDYNLVEKFVRIYPFNSKSVKSDMKELKLSAAFADAGFFDVPIQISHLRPRCSTMKFMKKGSMGYRFHAGLFGDYYHYACLSWLIEHGGAQYRNTQKGDWHS